MSYTGQTVENRVTGERVVVIKGTDETDGQEGIYDLFVAPGGAVAGEHIHSNLEEKFTVIKGKVGFRLDGVEQIAPLNDTVTIPPGMVHDWWNAGDEEAQVRVEVRPAARFELMILNLFGLANDGKTDAKGMPNPLQLAILGKEFQDVIMFTSPPEPIQKVMFAVVAPIAKAMGYQGTYEKYTSIDKPS